MTNPETDGARNLSSCGQQADILQLEALAEQSRVLLTRIDHLIAASLRQTDHVTNPAVAEPETFKGRGSSKH